MVLPFGGNLIGLSILVNDPSVYGDIQIPTTWTHPLTYTKNKTDGT